MTPSKDVVVWTGVRFHISDSPGPPAGPERWAACVLASVSDLPMSSATLAVEAAIQGRCPLIAVVAPNAEAVHDHVDVLIVAAEADHILTTFHSGPDGVEGAIWLLHPRCLAPGRVYVYSEPDDFFEAALRKLGLLVPLID